VGRVAAFLVCLVIASIADARAQTPGTQPERKPEMSLSGFAQADVGFDPKQNDSRFDRRNPPTKLPAFQDEFGRDGQLASPFMDGDIFLNSLAKFSFSHTIHQ
jgi:hypothetical protein